MSYRPLPRDGCIGEEELIVRKYGAVDMLRTCQVCETKFVDS